MTDFFNQHTLWTFLIQIKIRIKTIIFILIWITNIHNVCNKRMLVKKICIIKVNIR
jgi:hypothetical protein